MIAMVAEKLLLDPLFDIEANQWGRNLNVASDLTVWRLSKIVTRVILPINYRRSWLFPCPLTCGRSNFFLSLPDTVSQESRIGTRRDSKIMHLIVTEGDRACGCVRGTVVYVHGMLVRRSCRSPYHGRGIGKSFGTYPRGRTTGI